MIDMEKWLQLFTEQMDRYFGDRLVFIGLQGSYARGEACEGSDIDTVVIFDHLDGEDLERYRQAVDELPHRELLCGFVSGIEELEHWNRSELFQFYFDTTPIRGSLESLRPLIRAEDARRAVHSGACGIYHGCLHNFLHERSEEILRGLYKEARFVLQALLFCRTGRYVRTKAEMAAMTEELEKAIATADDFSGDQFAQLSEQLLKWAKTLICEYAEV